jgi:hypothetical protein
MGMLEKLGRFVVGGRNAIEDPTAALLEAYQDAHERMRMLQEHAALAPQEQSRQVLENLAQEAAQQIDRLRTALRERDIGLVPQPAPAAARASMNHWERLVQDLERHQASSARLRDVAMEFASSHPSAAAFLRRLGEEDARTCERLRHLIARADPQALD